jgi:2-polyprenyl-3-methyl-5-hydroxy-6-metoxy-1,4-benzoquinol methylase
MMAPKTEALIDDHDYFAAMQHGSKAEQLFHPARLRLIRKMASWRGRDVLELGSGTGCIAIPLAEAGAAVTAVELSAAHLDRLQRYSEQRGVVIEGVQADARELPFDDDSFDVVVVASLVHLVPGTDRLLHEAQRVCRPTGRLVIAGPWHRHPKSNRLLKTILRGGKAPDARKHQPFTEDLLKQQLKDSTFLGSKYNYPVGYFATLFVPDRKGA